MAESKWLVYRAGKWVGPFEENKLRESLARGSLAGTDLVKNEAGKTMSIHEALSKISPHLRLFGAGGEPTEADGE